MFSSCKILCKHDFNSTGLEAAELDSKCSFDCGSMLETVQILYKYKIRQHIRPWTYLHSYYTQGDNDHMTTFAVYESSCSWKWTQRERYHLTLWYLLKLHRAFVAFLIWFSALNFIWLTTLISLFFPAGACTWKSSKCHYPLVNMDTDKSPGMQNVQAANDLLALHSYFA